MITKMSETNQGLVQPEHIEGSEMTSRGMVWDWPSIVMLGLAVMISIWSFWPEKLVDHKDEKMVEVGQPSPGLWCVDAETGEPLVGMTPRGWFVWMVIAPADMAEKLRLEQEMEQVEKVWTGMADLDRWRRVLIVADKLQAEEWKGEVPAPALIPYEVGLATKRTWATWGSASRVRHVLIEPSGRILMIEPAELDQPGVLKRIAEDIRRRLRAWEGNFDDQPTFSVLSVGGFDLS
jgi:hypothetical protein